MFAALYVPVYFVICVALSSALLAKYKYAWDISLGIFMTLILGNAIYFLADWQHGIRQQGSAYTWAMLCLNILVASVVALLLWRAKRDPGDPSRLLVAHGSVLFWLSWISAPWLGELI